MNRLDKIKQEFLEQFHDKLAEEQVNLSVESAFDILVSADPSRNKKNVRWLMETYLDDGYLWEDISAGQHSKVHETLNTFIRNKNKLDIVDRSINRYQSIADMWKMVKEYADEKSGKEVKRDEHDKAMSETEIVIDNDDIRVVVPLTEYASKFHGRGTRWCTASDNNNMFWNYAKDAPLFIITLKESGDKLQLWKDKNKIQFMDADDKDVSDDYIEDNWQTLIEVIKYSGLLKFVPDMTSDGVSLRTPELCKIAIEQNVRALGYVPKELRTPELYELAVKQNKSALYNTPKDFITPELCELAVKNDGRALVFVPDKYKTAELCNIAVKQNGESLHYVPYKFKTPELCNMAIEQNGTALKYVPDMTSDGVSLKTPELCEIACKQNGRALQEVPYELITPALCELAVKNDGYALCYVPYKFKRQDEIYYNICKAAVQQNGLALRWFPKDLITPEICKLACEQDGRALLYVPDEYKTPELSEDELMTPELSELVKKQQLKDFSIPTDIYKKEINRFKEMSTIPLIEPSQTMHHTM